MKKIVSSHVTITLIALVALISLSCGDKSHAPSPVITSFFPNSGVIGSQVTLNGNNFVPPVPPPAGPLTNTSIVKFNGALTVADFVYQDSIGKQRINTSVPPGATSGKISLTANGITVSSQNDFIITTPTYVPNVTVTTALNYGGRGVALDANGNFYITNEDLHNIRKINPDGTVKILLTTSEFIAFGVGLDANGNVYAAVGNTIRKITPDGTVSTLAGSTGGYADGQGANAQFNFPWGIAVDASGNVYVGDFFNHKIRKITPDGTVSTLAGSSIGYADGQGANARFSFPQGVAVDAVGNVFVAEGNHKIRKITPSGNVTTVAGSTAGYKDGLGTAAQFNSPYGIAVDAIGTLFIGDGNNCVIRKITPGGDVATVAGSTFGYLDGPGASAKFGDTKGVVVDPSGIVYAIDFYNDKIRKIVIK